MEEEECLSNARALNAEDLIRFGQMLDEFPQGSPSQTVGVAHTQESAEDIFRIVHRFLDWLPEDFRKGLLKTSRSNVRQIVFPVLDSQYRVVSAGDRNAGRGLTVQNLHCSELARWPGDAAETLAGLLAS